VPTKFNASRDANLFDKQKQAVFRSDRHWRKHATEFPCCYLA